MLRISYCLIILIFLNSCSEQVAPVESRTIILGFDGMDPNLTEKWMAQGLLPNFSKLAKQGSYQRLGTSNPALSPVAWSSFATGTNPGEHGIFDFIRRDTKTYAPDFSITEIKPPKDTLNLFGFHIPLDEGEVINRRHGKPFWMEIEEKGQTASVLRVPVSFPPDPIHRMLSGMGVPDLLGTQGTYTLITSQFINGNDMGGRVQRIRANNGLVDTQLEGPQHPMKPDAGTLKLPLTIKKAKNESVTITLDDIKFRLKKNQWSSWVPLEFKFAGVMGVAGMVRFYLVESFPRISLYVSPINFNPIDPAMQISSPVEYSAELASRIGLYHTLGMPEETWSLNENRIPDSAYIQMVKHILAERVAMFFDTLDKTDSDLVIAVFVQTDRISHMFWRGIDDKHPLHIKTSKQAQNAILWIYQEADRILGKTLNKMLPNDKLLVLSDHGFSSFRRAVNLNRWLVDNGYLFLNENATESSMLFTDVDWSKSKAYALGMNGIFINRIGRESLGIVDKQEAIAIKNELLEKLSNIIDPRNSKPIITRTYDGKQVYKGLQTADAPDIVVGYAPSYRASWETVLGAVPKELIYDNNTKWSGDHAIDPSHVPGILFTSFKPKENIKSIQDFQLLLNISGQDQ